MATQIVSVQDGPRLTVAQLVSSPTLIPRRMLDMLDQQFLTDVVLRRAADAPSGSIVYFESTPLFAKDDPAILDEFGEIPTTNGSIGTPKVARVVRRALGLRVSKTMLDRNDIDAVNIQLTQIKNTMVRAWEDALFTSVVANAQIQSVTTAASWGAAASSSHIRADISAAKYLIKTASADAAKKQKFGYVADTLVISIETEEDLLRVTSLGFRGEALSSMAAASRLEIVSSPADGVPHRLVARGGRQELLEPCQGRPGTVVDVSELFYNYPARRKFLRSPSAEAGLCRAMLLDRAAAFPGVSFRLFSDGTLRLSLPAADQVQRIARCHDLEPSLLGAVEARGEGFAVRLVAASPELRRTDRKLL